MRLVKTTISRRKTLGGMSTGKSHSLMLAGYMISHVVNTTDLMALLQRGPNLFLLFSSDTQTTSNFPSLLSTFPMRTTNDRVNKCTFYMGEGLDVNASRQNAEVDGGHPC